MAFSLADYRDMSELRRGGMGRIYRATQISLDRPVVIKELLHVSQNDPTLYKRFENEARAAAALDHGNVIRIYDFGLDTGTFYIAMEFVDGADLGVLLQQPGFPEEVGLLIVLQALKGVHYSHEKGIIHRDVKPDNILVAKTGHVKVTDFGLAYAADLTSRLTKPDSVVGTPHYIAPEHLSGEHPWGTRSDVWSAGVVLYQVATRRLPFGGDNPLAIAYRIVHASATPVRKLAPWLPASLCRAISQCMERAPEKRIATLGPLIDALQDYCFEAGVRDPDAEIARYLAGETTVFAKAARKRRRRTVKIPVGIGGPRAVPKSERVLAVLLPGLSLALALVVAGLLLNYRSANPGRPRVVHVTQQHEPAHSSPQDASPAGNNSVATVPSPVPLDTAASRLPEVVNRDFLTTSIAMPSTAMVTSMQPAVPETLYGAAGSSDGYRADSGTLRLILDPATAEVYVDNVRMSAAEATEGKRLAAGPHSLIVKAAGYRTGQSTVNIDARSVHTLSVELKPLKTQSGGLSVLCEPDGTVYVDGTSYGQTPMEAPVEFTPGIHRIVIKRDGYRPYDDTVTVEKGTVKRLKVRLVAQ